MKKPIFLLCLLPGSILFAQNKIELKKSGVFVNDQRAADYDNKGSVLTTNRRIWFLVPGTKDTLLTITQLQEDFHNPLFLDEVYYRLNFTDAAKTSFYAQDPGEFRGARLPEKDLIGIFFNNKLQPLIENGKLNDAAIASIKAKMIFNIDSVAAVVNQVADSIKALKLITVERDKTLPVTFQYLPPKTYMPKFYSLDYDPIKRYKIFQGEELIGVVEKDITDGTFAKGVYSFYKIVTPMVINKLTLDLLPVATSKVQPATPLNKAAEIELTGTTNKYNIPTPSYNEAEHAIVRSLIDRGLL